MHARRLLLGLALLVAAACPIRGTTVVQPTFDRLVGTADYIVRARVTSVTSSWQRNPAQPGQRYIGSQIHLEILEVIKGTPPQPLVLEVVGGRVGDDELAVEGTPRFHPGEENILFVRGNGRSFFPLVGLAHGYFEVLRDGKNGRGQMLRHDGRLLFNEHELDPGAPSQSWRGTPLSPESFRERIQSRQREVIARERLR